MDEEGIDLPNDAYEILSKDGFLDTMTEQQAMKFSLALVKFGDLRTETPAIL